MAQQVGGAETGPAGDLIDGEVIFLSSSWLSRTRCRINHRCGVVPVATAKRRAKVRGDMCARSARSSIVIW
jgi:hypothetical protein